LKHDAPAKLIFILLERYFENKLGKVKFGARIPTSGPVSSTQRVVESAQLAEELGYESAWIMDHINNSFERHKQYPVGMGSHTDSNNTNNPNQFETISAFSFLAGKTERLKFGVGVMPVLLRDAVVLGKEIATMDQLSNSRFIWGVGVSNISDKPEFVSLGKPFLKYADRYDMLGEYTAAIKAIWSKEAASFHGKYVNFDDVTVYPQPINKHVPIWVGAYTLAGGIERPAVKYAIDHGDGWIYGFLIKPDNLRSMIQDFGETAKKAGKDMSHFDWCMQLRLAMGPTTDEANRQCEWIARDQPSMAKYAGYMWNKKEGWRDAEGATEAPKSSVETASVGTPSTVVKTVEQFVEAGATHFDLWYMYPNYEGLVMQMKLFAKEVMPSFT